MYTHVTYMIYICILQLIYNYKTHGVYKPTSNWGAHRLADISEISNAGGQSTSALETRVASQVPTLGHLGGGSFNTL